MTFHGRRPRSHQCRPTERTASTVRNVDFPAVKQASQFNAKKQGKDADGRKEASILALRPQPDRTPREAQHWPPSRSSLPSSCFFALKTCLLWIGVNNPISAWPDRPRQRRARLARQLDWGHRRWELLGRAPANRAKSMISGTGMNWSRRHRVGRSEPAAVRPRSPREERCGGRICRHDSMGVICQPKRMVLDTVSATVGTTVAPVFNDGP